MHEAQLQLRVFDRRGGEATVAIRFTAEGHMREVYVAPAADLPLVTR